MAYILIVEDDPDFGEAVSTVFHADGHEVRHLLETGTVIKSMQERRPDLVILDVMFPEDTSAGFRLARIIHNFHPEFERIPVLLLTAVNTRFPLGFGPADLDTVWMPAAGFLEKPVDFAVLMEKGNELLAQAAGEHSLREGDAEPCVRGGSRIKHRP